MSTDNNRIACVNTEIPQTEKIKLILSKDLMSQVNFLHNQVKGDEWSGILLYKVIDGDIEKPETLILKADYIYPMDIGSSAYTEFDYDEAYVDMHDKLPIIQDGKRVYKIGTIHTHHNMATFFSGTDTGELHTNSPKHNYYLSLIVNFACNYIAKVALYTPGAEYKMKFKGTSGEFEKVANIGGTMIIYDCQVFVENEPWFDERFNQIKEKKASKSVVSGYNYNYKYPKDTYYEEFDKKYNKKEEKRATKQIKMFEQPVEQISTYALLSIICRSITGNMAESSDLYNVLKRKSAEHAKMGDGDLSMLSLHTMRETFKTNFKKACGVYKGKEFLTKFQLDEFAEECTKIFKSYTFPNAYDDVIDCFLEALDSFVIKSAASL